MDYQPKPAYTAIQGVLEANLGGAPAAPTGLTTTAGDGQVQLSWTASAGATGYNVKRAMTSGGPYTTVASVAGTSYTNTGLTNGTPYFFVVSAVNSNGESPNSTQVSATPQAVANFSLSAAPASLSVTQGASGSSTINIARSGGFTGAVALSASGLPAGVTATFSPASATGASSTLSLNASATAATGMVNLTITGTGGGLTRTTPLILTVNASGGGGGTGGVTVAAAVTSSSPWFNEQSLRLSNTAPITALTVTITVQRTTGISFSGLYNTVGGQILQSNSSTPTTVTYQFTLAAGQTLGAGNNRLFAAQTSGTGTAHPFGGDTYTVTYTTGGVSYTQTGHF